MVFPAGPASINRLDLPRKSIWIWVSANIEETSNSGTGEASSPRADGGRGFSSLPELEIQLELCSGGHHLHIPRRIPD